MLADISLSVFHSSLILRKGPQWAPHENQISIKFALNFLIHNLPPESRSNEQLQSGALHSDKYE